MRTSVLWLALLVSGCGEAPVNVAEDPGPAAGTATGTAPRAGQLTQRQAQQWSDSCALCHVTGVAAAPLTGNVQQWQPRLAQGRDVLLIHTLEGFNDMPPLGYCMSCEREDFIAMIEFMAGGPR